MSHRKTKPKNRPPLSNPLNVSSTSTSSLHLTSFHPHKPLYSVATTAVGQNVVRIFDVRAGVAEPRCEVRLKKGEEVSCLAWRGGDKKRKRRQSMGEDGLLCGLKSGRIYVIEPASGEIVRKVEGHAASVNGWCTDEERAWSCGGDGKVKCWDSRTGNCVS
jgi:WD40 repeat protein